MIQLTIYKGKTIGVFGLGKAGAATVAALLAGGADVYAWDDKPESVRAMMRQGSDSNLELTPYDAWPWEKFSAFVPAPGVALTFKPHPSVEMARKAGVEIIGDIELLYRQCPDVTYVGITGTNGKSTTTTLIAHILKSAGRNIQVGGNLGTAALSLEPLEKEGVYVLETSSYQLDLLARARFNIAALLNVTPDHLDRHGDMKAYITAKMHIFDRQTQEDVAIVAVDDAYTKDAAQQLSMRRTARVIPASTGETLKRGIYVNARGVLHDSIDVDDETLFDLKSHAPRLPGRHNWQNAAVAYAVCHALGVDAAQIVAGLKTFPGLAHRMEWVAEIGGVTFINDSKATNAEAAANALAPYDTIYWILGGKPKEGGIESLAPCFPKIQHAFLIGQAGEEFARTLEGQAPFSQCGTLKNAFDEASMMALREKKPGAVVLLSPACASWDQWKNFEERGDAFCEMVRAILPRA